MAHVTGVCWSTRREHILLWGSTGWRHGLHGRLLLLRLLLDEGCLLLLLLLLLGCQWLLLG
jgi:hypothetical protein